MASIVNGIIEHIQPGNTPYAIASTAYGECTIGANTSAKTVEMTGFSLQPGVTIHIKFINNNTALNPTLNVNNTGAKPIVSYNDTSIGSTINTDGWPAGAILTLTYDGTNWVKDYDNHPLIQFVTWNSVSG